MIKYLGNQHPFLLKMCTYLLRVKSHKPQWIRTSAM